MDVDIITAFLRAVFFTFIVISIFLLMGTFLRAKVKMLQKLFLPASVIGGFIGLLLGPIVLKEYAIFPLPEVWIMFDSLLSGLLFVTVVVAVTFVINLCGLMEEGANEGGQACMNDHIMMTIL